MKTTAPAPADAGSPATTPPAGAPGLVAWYAEGFSDILGDRLRLFDNAGPALELLRFHPAVATLPGFDGAVRARVEALANFSHPSFARVRTLKLLDDPHPQLALVSELVAGERLSTVLRAAEARGARLDATCAIWVLRHLLPALDAFHEATGGASHRLLDADRVVVTPDGGVAITEYVFGGLAEELLLAPRTSDVGQAALLAVAILRGQPLRPDEHDGSFDRLVQHACALSPSADVLRPWLTRAVSAGPDRFKSAREAYHALDELLPGVWGSWPVSRQLAEAPAAVPVPAPARAVQRRPLWQRAFPLPPAGPESVATRRLRRANVTLAAVVAVEAVCIVFLLARGVSSRVPADESRRRPTIEAAGLIPAVPAASPAGAVPVSKAGEAAPSSPATGTAAPAAVPDTVLGWLVIESAVEVKVYVNGRLLGSTTGRRFGVPAGEHLVTLVNDTLNYRSSQPVRIVAGRSVMVTAKP